MTARVDSWIWAIRLTKTRSAAGAACRAGHVRVNGAPAKPAQRVAIGDEVRVRLHGHERIVEVAKILSKRGSAAVAAECFIDHSPPPPPREVLVSQPRRDPGAGRPTKRERRELDRLRGGIHGGMLIALIACIALVVSSCSSGSDSELSVEGPPGAPARAGSGPDFGECGRVTADEVRDITQMPLPVETFRNPSVCEWAESDARTGAVASFNWYRGSPIGREQALVELARNHVEDIEVAGHRGYVAYTPAYALCELGIDFGPDFILWSLRSGITLTGEETRTNEQLCASATELTELVIERAS